MYEPEAIKTFTSPLFSGPETLPTFNESERQIIDQLVRLGPQTQAQIAKSTKLSQQSVSRLLTKLGQVGVIRSGQEVAKAGQRGQRSVTVEIVPEFAFSFGISIMADAVSVVLLNLEGTAIAERWHALDDMGQQNVLSHLIGMIRDITENTSALKPDRVIGAGVAISGYFLDETARVAAPPSLREWALVDIEVLFKDILGIPVWLENDGNVAAIGESKLGVGKWYHNFAYLYVATGFGGGIVAGGKLLRGRFGNAGEFGGIIPQDIYQYPNLELLRQMVSDDGVDVNTVSDMLKVYDPEWPAVERWVEAVTPAFTLVVSAISAIIDTEAIVFGGRMPTDLCERLIPKLHFYHHPRRTYVRPTAKLIPAKAKGNPTAVGAATLPFKAKLYV